MLTHGRNVSYDIPDPDLPEISQWLIGNPNRANLGRIGLKFKGRSLLASDISEPWQELHLWNGFITSKFRVDGTPVEVVTQADLDTDAVAFEIESDLIASGDLEIEFDFPYPPIHGAEHKYEVFAGVYDFPLNHTTELVLDSIGSVFLTPSDTPSQRAPGIHLQNGTPVHLGPRTKSEARLHGAFLPVKQIPAPPALIRVRSSAAWTAYWSEGGFVDVVTGSSNPNATELQRRIVLSQYHVRVNSASSRHQQPPQESGLLNNGWYGKFHMEMVVWHCAHWATWGRQYIFDGIFPGIYDRFLESSLERARRMGWAGARWPKMTESVTGRSSPGAINGLLMWQQLAYWHYGLRVAQHWKTLLGLSVPEAWPEVSANLAPLPTTTDATTGNTYYAVYEGLNSSWWTDGDAKLTGDPRSLIMLQGILPDLPPLPRNNNDNNNKSIPATADEAEVPRERVMVDPEIARATSDRVWDVWGDERIHGWGRPVLVINAARTGRPDRAVYHLTAFDYWTFDDAGKRRPSFHGPLLPLLSLDHQLTSGVIDPLVGYALRAEQGGIPPPFMPGNAGLLYAGKSISFFGDEKSPMIEQVLS
ncbi:Six-hairpin glycosidase-like protein [Apiospora saccharicola]